MEIQINFRNMKNIRFSFSFLLMNVLIISSIFGQEPPGKPPRQIIVQGHVLDSTTLQPLVGVRIDLKNTEKGIIMDTVYSEKDGRFEFRITDFSSVFLMEASFPNYKSSSSSIFTVNEFKKSILLDNIYLQKDERISNSAALNGPTVIVDTIPLAQFVENKLDVLDIYPSHGAETLFYALNPELKGRSMIPENFPIKAPVFPYFKDDRKQFNRKFKQDKKKGEPFISFNEGQSKDIGLASAMVSTDEMMEMHNLTEFLNMFGSRYDLQSNVDQEDGKYINQEVNERSSVFNALRKRTKKFVFVFWKYGADNIPILVGPQVENRFKVFYYTERTQATPNVTSNATFGYAPMVSAKYFIKVYDQQGDPDIPIRVSDTEIDPRVYFDRYDLLYIVGKPWIKIPIQIL